MAFRKLYEDLGLWPLLEGYPGFTEQLAKRKTDFLCQNLDFNRISPLVETHWQQSWLESVYSRDCVRDVERMFTEYHFLTRSFLHKNLPVAEELFQIIISKVDEGHGRVPALSLNALAALSEFLYKDVVSSYILISILRFVPSSDQDVIFQNSNVFVSVLKFCIEQCRFQNTENTNVPAALSTLLLTFPEYDNVAVNQWFSIFSGLSKIKGLSSNFIYVCLLSHEHLVLLKQMSWHFAGSHTTEFNGSVELPDLGKGTNQERIKNFFEISVKNRNHWILSFVETSIFSCLNLEDPRLQEAWPACCHRLLPVMLLHSWGCVSGGTEIASRLHSLYQYCEKHAYDPVFEHLSHIVGEQVELLTWCLAHNKKGDVSNLEILHIAEGASALKTLWRAADLSEANWKEICKLLSSRWSGRGRCKKGKSSNTGDFWDVVVFEGFCILMMCFEIIFSVNETEYFEFSLINGFQSDYNCRSRELSTSEKEWNSMYKEKTAKKLEKIKAALLSIVSIQFRVEIMENIFSLLFLKPDGLEEVEDSDTSIEEGAVEDSFPDQELGIEGSVTSSVKSHPCLSESSEAKNWIHESLESEASKCDVLPLDILDEPLTHASFMECEDAPEVLQHELTVAGATTVNPYLKTIQGPAKGDKETEMHTDLAHRDFRKPSTCTEDSEIGWQPLICNEFGGDDHGDGTTCHSVEDGQFHSNCCKHSHKMCYLGENSSQSFICSWPIVKDLLHVLEECLDETRASLCSKERELSSGPVFYRTERLSQYTKEAIWRLQLFEDPISWAASGNSVVLRHSELRRVRKGVGQCLSTKCVPISNCITQMLSSPSSLIVQFLAREWLTEVQEVTEMYPLDPILVSDITFTKALYFLRQRLKSPSKDLGSPMRQQPLLLKVPELGQSSEAQVVTVAPLLQFVKQVATEGAFTAWLTREVGIFLSSVSPVLLPEIEYVMAEFSESENILNIATNGSNIAMLDLLLTASSTFEHTTSLLDVMEQFVDLRTFSSTSSKSPGISCAQFVLSAVDSFRILNKGDKIHPQTASGLSDLLQSHIYPISSRGSKEHDTFWKAVNNELEHSSKRVLGNESGCEGGLEKSSVNELHERGVLCKLIKICSLTDVSGDVLGVHEETQGQGLYLYKLLIYLTLMTRCLKDKFPLQDHHIFVSCDPRILLKSQEMETAVLEKRVTAVAYYARHNLVHTIAHAVNSATLLGGVLPTEVQTHSQELTVVLNQQENWAGPVDHPCTTVAALLEGLLEALKKVAGGSETLSRSQAQEAAHDDDVLYILNETAALALVDFSLLMSTHEVLAFFINLTNLLWLHSLLTLEIQKDGFGLLSSCSLKRKISQSRVKYCIGQGKLFSLHDLQTILFGAEWPELSFCESVKTFNFPSPRDVRALFVVTNGHEQSPRLQVLHLDQLDMQLNTAVLEYLRPYSSDSGGCLPVLLTSQNKGSSIMRQKCSLKSDNVLKNFCQTLEDNLNMSSQEDLRSFCQTIADCAKFVNISYTFTIRLQGTPTVSSTLSHTEPSDRFSVQQKRYDSYLRFLESHCWLVAYIVNNLRNLESQKKSSIYEAEKFEPWNPSMVYFDRLISSRSVDVLKILFGDNATLCALQMPFAGEHVWPYLENFLRREKLDALELIWALPEGILMSDPHLQVVTDTTLFEFSSAVYTGDNAPWKDCLLLNDHRLKVQCAVEKAMLWPREACEQLLSSLLGDRLNHLSSSKATILKQHLHRMQMSLQWSEQNPEIALHCLETDVDFVILLLESEKNDFSVIEQLLLSLPAHQAFAICKNVLEKIKSYNMKFLIVNFIVDSLSSILTASESAHYTIMALGVRMLDFIPEIYHAHYWDLIVEPHLILEELLMNSQFQILERVLNALRPTINHLPISSLLSTSSVDELLRGYANRALECNVRGVEYTAVDLQSNSTVPVPRSLEESQNEDLPYVTTEAGKKLEFVMPDKVPQKSEWMPDNQASDCLCCGTVSFSMFNRRHHCRRCGRLVCGSCSTKRMKVAGYGAVHVRACDDCVRTTEANANSSQKQEAFVDVCEAEALVHPEWRLMTDPAHNATVRNEFNFEHAPSVSLCLTVLKAHSEQASLPRFLLNACMQLLQLLHPTVSGTANPEVDYTLVLRMVRSLLVAAKLKYSHYGLNTGVAQCDSLLQQADLLNMLIEGGCSSLIPSKPISGYTLRQLRDLLLAQEHWMLAVDISTKTGLDLGGIWAAWGRACLRAGCWAEARDKYARCLEAVVPSGARPSTDPPVLTEVLHILQAGPSVHSCHMAMQAKPEESGSPASVLCILASLEDVKQGHWAVKPGAAPAQKPLQLPPCTYEECLYYLQTYGSPTSLLGFYLNYGLLDQALKHVCEAHVEADVFLYAVYLCCLRDGRISLLFQELSTVDPTLVMWKPYLEYVCQHLVKNQLYHSLYQLQLFMRDLVRASMTCVKFYRAGCCSYSDLARNSLYLNHAESHLQEHLEAQLVPRYNTDLLSENQPRESDQKVQRRSLTTETRKLDTYINTVQRQAEVARFLQTCESRGVPVLGLCKKLWPVTTSSLASQPPTLFDTRHEQLQLAVLAILCGQNVEEGFGIAFRIMQDYHLQFENVYGVVAQHLASEEQIVEVEKLVDCVQQSGVSDTTALCDKILIAAIQEMMKKGKGGDVERLVRLLVDASAKISMFIECSQLKSAYLLAVKYNRSDDIYRIMKEAKRLGQTSIEKICVKKLNLPM